MTHRLAPITRSFALASLLLAGSQLRAQVVPDGLVVETLAPGLSDPVAFEILLDGRVLIAEQFTGRVLMARVGIGVQAQPVLQVPNVVAGGERGLLGLAVDPRFPSFPYLYVFHDAPSPNHIRISRYTLGGGLDPSSGLPLTADVGTRFDLLDVIPDDAPNHNGGTLRFGPLGMLFASLGEDAVPCAAQDPSGLRGVVLRMDVSRLPPGAGHATFAQLIPADNPFASAPDSVTRLVVALGLRNPFRVQMDWGTGQLVIGDVGESVREELDLLVPPGAALAFGAAAAGSNFGWPYLEGTTAGAHAGDCAPAPPGLALPAFEYDRTSQSFGAAIIPAGIYWPPLEPLEPIFPPAPRWPVAISSGSLFYSDYYTGALVRLEYGNFGAGLRWQVASPVAGQPTPEHFGEGFDAVADWRFVPDATLWFVQQSIAFQANSGRLGRIRPAAPPPPAPVPIALRVFGTPGNGAVSFRLSVTRDAHNRLSLHDLTGRTIRMWSDEEFGRRPTSEGYVVDWDGRDDDGRRVPPGLYVSRLESLGTSVSARVVFLR